MLAVFFLAALIAVNVAYVAFAGFPRPIKSSQSKNAPLSLVDVDQGRQRARLS
jgi:hypothetical protein